MSAIIKGLMPPKLRTPLIVLGAVILLAATAFIGLSLLNPNLASLGGVRLPGAPTDTSGKKPGITFDVIPATEIPATHPDLVGRLEARQDNSLRVRPDTKGAPAPVVEVVVTGQTRLYRNATGDQLRNLPPSGATIQMVVAPYSIEQVAPGDSVIAWGERRGDRIVADVVLVETQSANTSPPAPGAATRVP